MATFGYCNGDGSFGQQGYRSAAEAHEVAREKCTERGETLFVFEVTGEEVYEEDALFVVEPNRFGCSDANDTIVVNGLASMEAARTAAQEHANKHGMAFYAFEGSFEQSDQDGTLFYVDPQGDRS